MRSLRNFFPTPLGLALLGLLVGQLAAADIHLGVKLAAMLPLAAFALVSGARWAFASLSLVPSTGRRAAAVTEAVDDDF